MIYHALDVLKCELGDFLKSLPELNISESQVVELSNVAKEDGTVAISNNRLGMSLVNIEEERIVRDVSPYRTNPDNSVSHLNPEVRLNLMLLFSAHFGVYDTSLRFIAGVIRFFQKKSVFTPDNSPTMDGIERLVAELYPLNLEQQNNLWGALGAKYLPSVLYKVRAISIQEGQIRDQQAPITTIEIVGRGKEPE
jgi:hypothetical protein